MGACAMVSNKRIRERALGYLAQLAEHMHPSEGLKDRLCKVYTVDLTTTHAQIFEKFVELYVQLLKAEQEIREWNPRTLPRRSKLKKLYTKKHTEASGQRTELLRQIRILSEQK